MGLFDAEVEVYCQNDEVSLDVHARCTVRYPHGSTQQAASVDPLLI